jgi:hypothetical protein
LHIRGALSAHTPPGSAATECGCRGCKESRIRDRDGNRQNFIGHSL